MKGAAIYLWELYLVWRQKKTLHILDKYPGENKGRGGLRTSIPRNLKWLEKNNTI